MDFACKVLLSWMVVLAGCQRTPAPSDAHADAPPAVAAQARIVAAGSSVTETIYALGAGADLVGVDSSSLFPEAATKLPQIGYQRTLAAEGILALQPSLVLVSGEAGPPTVFEQLRGAGVRVEVIAGEQTVEAGEARIRRIAELVGRDATPVIAQLDADLARAQQQREQHTSRPKVIVLYAHSANTVHVFGRNTPAETLLQLAGAENAVSGFEGPKPLTPEALAKAAPDAILLPTRALERVGGIAGLLQVPGVALTPAAAAKRIVTFDDTLLLGFSPRTGQAAIELGAKLAAP
ncbi:MAG: ABC transporter substrate-binding protein [Polyangiales bacterium]